MTTYYCDVTGDFVSSQTGADHTGNQWQGPYGLQKAIDTVTAGNELYIYGTAALTRLVNMTLGKDVSAWSVDDEVRNDTGDGDHWTGVVCEISGTSVVIELDSGITYDDVNDNDRQPVGSHRSLTTLFCFSEITESLACMGDKRPPLTVRHKKRVLNDGQIGFGVGLTLSPPF